MRSLECLASLHSLEDLSALVEALGGTSHFSPFEATAFRPLLRGATLPDRVAEVGRFGALPCIGIEGEDPGRAGARLARATASRGEPVFVLAIPPDRGRLIVAVGADPAAVISLDPAAPDRVVVAMLHRLHGLVGEGRVATALRFAEALGGKRIDRGFFAAFREVRDRFVEEGPAAASREERRALALLDLTRVLFLYFIQQKGWLDGRDDFLARAVDDHLAGRRGLQRHLLHPLFFGTLNRPEATRAASVRRFGRIPFLNGGLFEPHPLERRWTIARSDAAWRSAFDDLFEHFHFTLNEQGEGLAVAPDMLGRVFEGLMAEDERRLTGTFYTPSHLVDRIVAAAIESLLAERLGIVPGAAGELIRQRDPIADQVLSRCRVLDPAVGSGAFLLGTLELFDRLALARDPRPDHRRRILRSRLFGVDLSAEAVRLAELRLWLAAVRDDPDGPESPVEPLPNLDASLRQGDTLHDPRWLAGLRRAPTRSARALSEARRLFAGLSGPGKKEAWRALRSAELEAARESLTLAAADLDQRIDLILGDARAPDLFGTRRGLDRPLRAALRAARDDRRRINGARRRLAHDGALPWFDAPSAFGEVFATAGGFDLVIGNPPWVRAEELPARSRTALAERYKWWNGGTGPFSHRPDLAVAFLERGLELTAPGGVLAMLVPAKIVTAAYGTAARQGLAATTSLDRIADLTREDSAAFDAVTYPLALITRKRPPSETQVVATTLIGPGTIPQPLLCGGPWILGAPDAGRVAERVRREGTLLGADFAIHLGVKSGCNAAFLHPPAEIERGLIRPAVRGRDLQPFRHSSTTPLLYPHDRLGRPRRTLPPGALRHLARYRGELEARADATSGPWWALHRTIPASAPHRVAWPDLARRLQAVPLAEEIVPLNSCYFAIAGSEENALALCGWLNTSWIRAITALGADPARGGFARFNARTVARVPWRVEATRDRRLIGAVRRAIRGEEGTDDIDHAVAEHLGLDARDRRALRPLA